MRNTQNCEIQSLFFTMKYALLLPALLLMTSCSNIQVSSVEALPYKDDCKAAISFTFDDGMLCHYTDIAPELEKRDMRGTFWIIGANMDTDSPDYPWMTWQQVADLAKRGHEISNHSWHHPDLTQLSEDSLRWEIAYNDSVLESVTGRRPRTFCYPYNAMSDLVVKVANEGRVGTRTYQAAHGQAESHQTADSLTQWLNDVIAQGIWGVTMTHGTTYGWDMWNEPEVLYAFFDEVNAVRDQVWVATFEEVAAYVEETKNLTTKYVYYGNTIKVTAELNDLSPELFDQPLTFAINGSFGDGLFKAVQEGTSLSVLNQGTRLLINAIPNGKEIVITKE